MRDGSFGLRRRGLGMGFGLGMGLAALAAGSALAQQSCDLDSDLEQQRGFDKYFTGCGKAAALRLRAAAGLPVSDGQSSHGYSSREASSATDLLSVDLDIELIPAAGASPNTITGSNTMRVKSNVNGLTQFTYALRTQYVVSLNNTGLAADLNKVQLNGTTAASSTTPGTNSYYRTITLDRAYNLNEEFTVKIWYSGEALSRGFGSIEFQTTGGGNPIIASLSEAYYAATWWPVKDGDVFQPGDNGDKSTGSIAITVPNTLKAISNGLLTSETVPAAGKKKYRWTTNYQTSSYLYCISASNYNQWSRTYTFPLAGGGNGTMPVQFSIYPEDDTTANRAAWEKCVDMLPVFRTVYGEYPFINEKYGIYQFPFGGGMEHQTYTGQGTFSENVTAHELAHQWWGDNVTCKYWNDIWLNEGFATYGEALWVERRAGSAGLPALFAAMFDRRPSAVTDSVYVPTAQINNMNRIFSSTYTYRKGGWVLHMLRHAIGDTAFFNTLAAYRAAYQGQGATTDNFRDVAAAVSGKNLTNFFQGWVYGIGAPEYAFGWNNVTVNGQRYLRLDLKQVQNAAWGVTAAPLNGAFDSPIDIRIDDASGSRTVQLQNAARLQHYLIPVSSATSGVTLDEFDWVLNLGKTNEAYTNGPAKVISTSPVVASSLALAPTTVDIAFSEPVTAAAGNFTVIGPGGAVPFTYSYLGASNTARLTFTGTLAAGTYTVTASAAITTVASGNALDGEITASLGAGALPSGDGLPGGNAVFSFSVSGCVADFDNGSGTGTPDGGVGIEDLLYYLGVYDAGVAAADVDDGTGTGVHDGGVGIEDLLYYLTRYDAGC